MKKLNLKQLKVMSFVTNVDEDLQNTVRGGASVGCDSEIPHHCPPTYAATCPCI